MWDRSLYPDTNIIEIRPIDSIVRKGTFSDLLGFDSERIFSWMEQGYDDSIHILKRVFEAVNQYNKLDQSSSDLLSSISSFSGEDEALVKAMKRISDIKKVTQ